MGPVELITVCMMLAAIFGALMLVKQHAHVVEPSGEPRGVNDSSNPYAPPTVTVRVVETRFGCGFAAFAILVGLVLGAVFLFIALSRGCTPIGDGVSGAGPSIPAQEPATIP